MRRSKSLAKIHAGEPVRICSLGHYVPAYVRHAAHHGFDCIWLDLEHRLIDERSAQALLAYCHLADIDCMVRVPTLERAKLYRYLEDGAAGLMVPHVSSVEKAEALVEAVRFPPIGNRGLDGAGLDGDFLLDGREKYPEAANRETFLVVQIEHPDAVENVDAIAAVEGVDGLFIGPADLSLRLRLKEGSPSLQECTRRVAAAAVKHTKAWGAPVGSVEQLREMHAQGAQLLAHGNEFQGLMRILEESARNFDEALK